MPEGKLGTIQNPIGNALEIGADGAVVFGIAGVPEMQEPIRPFI
jgi:hypothetical protein